MARPANLNAVRAPRPSATWRSTKNAAALKCSGTLPTARILQYAAGANGQGGVTMLRRMAVVLAVSMMFAAPAAATELQWWSHWAIEDSKKAVLFEAKRRFEAANPGHTVTITFYEKKNMWPALRAAFTAGSGFPDVFYYDMDVPEFMTAGWLADLSNGVRWQNIEPFGKAFWTRPGPGGKTGTWAIPVEAASDELYYNRKLFKQLGITVPAGYAFTQA